MKCTYACSISMLMVLDGRLEYPIFNRVYSYSGQNILKHSVNPLNRNLLLTIITC